MSDIKLFRPQRLTDNPDGGGLATATPIVDGQINNIFDDISRIDRVNGELSLRKVFTIADTDDTALYSDLHLTIAAKPLDPRVSAVMFRVPDWDSEREDARATVERFLDESVISRMVPYDRQLAGQRTVLAFQRPELAIPEIGEVYALKDEVAGRTEFIRVQKVEHQEEVFTDTAGDYRVRVITLTLSQPLSQEFVGAQPNRYFAPDQHAVLRKTFASDAGRYKGVATLALDAAPGDLTITVDSIFAQLVPAATGETPVVDARPPGGAVLVPASDDIINFSGLIVMDVGAVLYLPTAVMPGTLIGLGDPRGTLTDDGAGHMKFAGDGTLPSGTVMGVIDYAAGTLTAQITSATFSGYLWKYQPAAAVPKTAWTTQIPVQIQNRGYVYTASLQPVPQPGSVVLSYRAQGRWYTLTDDGTGALRGEPGVGSGVINFQTGSLQATLGALPDIDSAVIIAWGGSSQFERIDGAVSLQSPVIEATVADGNIEPGTFSVQWYAGGILKTATDNGQGVLSGDGTGRVVYGTGEYALRPTLLPDPNTEYVATYQAGSTHTELFNPTKAGGSISLQLSNPIRPRSLSIGYTSETVTTAGTYTSTVQLTDNGTGQLLKTDGTVLAGSVVDYATALVTFSPDFTASLPQLQYVVANGSVPRATIPGGTLTYGVGLAFYPESRKTKRVDTPVTFVNGTLVTAKYKEDAANDAPSTDTAASVPLKLDLLPLISDSLLASGLLFRLGGKRYYARGGTLFHTINPANGSGTAAGSFNPATGRAVISNWTGGVSPALVVEAGLSQTAVLPMSVMHGRTPGSPIRPGSFFVQAVRARDGQLISAIADNNGNVTTSSIHGSVDSTTGVFSLGFGAWVLDSSLSPEDKAEPWYDAAAVQGDGRIWRPDGVVPESVTFNCVVEIAIEQDPDIIKVNPVRLPSDGRVPIFRPGDTLVISETLPYTLPNGLSAGQVIPLPRGDLASVALYDANGLGVPSKLYGENLVAGEITMATPLNLGAYMQPLVALHTIEDMALCLDAQITGQLTLSTPLTKAYAAGQGVCSSALVLGNAQARYERLFEQNTWTNVWSDTLIGTAPVGGAQYNDALAPVEVKNADAITQRWRISFNGPTTYQVVGETLGVIASGNTSEDLSPINPATGQPYFTLRALGMGGGWAVGNQIRFNTVAAGGPVWIARTVRSGPPTELEDRIRLDVRWDKD